MVLATLRIVPRPREEEHTLAAVRTVADSTRALPGCVHGEIYREVDPPWALVYAEAWADERHLEEHLLSPDYDLVLDLMESSAEPPSLEFRLVAETRDLAWVERLRLDHSGERRATPGPPPRRGFPSRRRPFPAGSRPAQRSK